MGNLVNATTKTQKRGIKSHLKKYRKIDAHTAREKFGCERLPARIWELRNDPSDPMEIETTYIEGTNRYGHYVRFAVYRYRGTKK